MKITIELDDKELKDQVTQMVASQFYSDFRTMEQDLLRGAVKDAVLEVVYKEKPALLEACVDRAYKELVRKAMPIMYEKFDNAIEDYMRRKEQ